MGIIGNLEQLIGFQYINSMFPIDELIPPNPGTPDWRLLELVATDGTSVAARATRELKISRQAINKRLRELVEMGVLTASGKTRSRTYTLATREHAEKFSIDGADEGTVWRQFVGPKLNGLTDAWAIAQYAFTEIYNNAIDHSEGQNIIVLIDQSALTVKIAVADDGIGIFRKLQNAYGFSDEREAVLELVKGRLTTDESRHTGWGIFYTSRMCDHFSITSGNYYFAHRKNGDDWCMEDAQFVKGTRVWMTISTHPTNTVQSVLKQYSMPNTISLNITHVPLALAQYGEEKLISRSQAKQVAVRLEWFARVILDFTGVTHVGQAFADELFRVWQRDHPSVELVPINLSPDVHALIKLAQSALAAEQAK